MGKQRLDDFLEFIEKKHGEENWVTVYKQIRESDDSADGAFYCALVSEQMTDRAMTNTSWDLMLGSGGPGFVTTFENGAEKNTYYTESNP